MQKLPLFHQTAVSLAHFYWQHTLHPGDYVIDATCGNGKDTSLLLKYILPTGKLYAIDIQEEAIKKTRENLNTMFSTKELEQVDLMIGCHSSFPKEIEPGSINLITYNLGYLPGSNKSCITNKETTLRSLIIAQKLIKVGGAISVTCYPGHEGGKKETEEILNWTKNLSPKEWVVCHHAWNNRNLAPSLVYLIRIK